MAFNFPLNLSNILGARASSDLSFRIDHQSQDANCEGQF